MMSSQENCKQVIMEDGNLKCRDYVPYIIRLSL